MPDRFNATLDPFLKAALPEIESLGQHPDDASRSYIRSLYVYLDNMTEAGDYQFSLLALLRADTSDEIQSALDDALDELCQQIETVPGFSLCESDALAGLAERESTLPVSILGQYVKLNLDYISLSHGDPDTGV